MMTPEEIARCGHTIVLDRACDDCWERVQSQLGLARLALAASEQRECDNCNWLTLQKQELEIKLEASEQRVFTLQQLINEKLPEYVTKLAASERALERAKEVINLKIAHKGACVFVTEDFTGPECTCGKLDAALASSESPQ